MSEPVHAIRNIGPRSVEGFARAGLHTAEDVREIGADVAYARLIAAGTRPHFIGYYALVLGLQGRHWNDIDAQEKAALRGRFDAIVAGAGGKARSALEAELDRLGVTDRVAPSRK